jgi:hypothetical protein
MLDHGIAGQRCNIREVDRSASGSMLPCLGKIIQQSIAVLAHRGQSSPEVRQETRTDAPPKCTEKHFLLKNMNNFPMLRVIGLKFLSV